VVRHVTTLVRLYGDDHNAHVRTRWKLAPILGLVLCMTPLTACSWGVERICAGDEVFVLPGPGWGGYCEKRNPGDKACSDGQRLRMVFNPPREDCIKDEVGHVNDGLPKRFK
jgi:hypothetical protein